MLEGARCAGAEGALHRLPAAVRGMRAFALSAKAGPRARSTERRRFVVPAATMAAESGAGPPRAHQNRFATNSNEDTRPYNSETDRAGDSGGCTLGHASMIAS